MATEATWIDELECSEITEPAAQADVSGFRLVCCATVNGIEAGMFERADGRYRWYALDGSGHFEIFGASERSAVISAVHAIGFNYSFEVASEGAAR